LVEENHTAAASKTLKTTVAVILLPAGISTGAQGFVPSGTSTFGGGTRGPVQLRGTVVCAKCTLDEIRKAQPHEHTLYELTPARSPLVSAHFGTFSTNRSNSPERRFPWISEK
jgi:hypothetical protein